MFSIVSTVPVSSISVIFTSVACLVTMKMGYMHVLKLTKIADLRLGSADDRPTDVCGPL